MSSAAKPLARPVPVPFLELSALHATLQSDLDAAWRRTVTASTFIGGEDVDAFEASWASYCGASHAVGVANGTDALVLTLRALGIGPGDEVVLPTNTFVATAEAVALTGAVPRFCDVDPETLLLTPELLEGAITRLTAAVVVVHLFGHVPDMEALLRVVERHGLALIEDAAQAHGATRHGQRAGSFGHAACFSFYPGKNLGALGDAGAVVTSSAELARRVRTMANHGREGAHHTHELLGTNSRLDGLQAAFLGVKLAHLDAWNEGRRAAADAYRIHLAEAPVRLVREVAGSHGVDHLFVVRVRDRDRVRAELQRRGVTTGIHYPVPCHQQPPFMRFARETLPIAEGAAQEILSLPMFPHISASQIARVSDAVLDVATAS